MKSQRTTRLYCLLFINCFFTLSLVAQPTTCFWKIVGINSLPNGLVPADISKKVGIGVAKPQGDCMLTVESGLNVGIYSDYFGSGVGILSKVYNPQTKAFSVSLANNGSSCETFRVYGNGKVECKEVTIRNYGWCDYVFEPDYKLMSLAELKSYVMTNKHLPEVPTEADINANGMDVFETQKLLLKKVEELTLYMISLDEQITALKKKE